MKVYYGFIDLPPIPNPVASVGSFDGVHRGHRLLIRKMNALARQNQGESIIVTFDPHPRQFLKGENRLLTTTQEKLILLEEAGADNVIVVNFDEEFSKTNADQFVGQYLKGVLGAKIIVSGKEHNFGHKRSGSSETIEHTGIESRKLRRYENISSTIIRNAVAGGEMDKAAQLLGGGYLVITPVTEQSKLLPPPGKYLVTVDEAAPEAMEIQTENLRNMKPHLIRVLDKISGQPPH